jgi:hypothetical protein
MKLSDNATRVKEIRKKRKSRKAKIQKRNGKAARKSIFSLFRFLIIISVFIGLYLLIKFNTKYWNGKDKVNLVINSSGDTMSVVTFDPARGEIDTILIPVNTQVDVATGLGRWKLKSIWKLGEEEKLNGLLLAKTLTNQLKLPVYIWADHASEGLASRNLVKIFKAVSVPYKTNMGVGDKIKIAFFNLSVKSSARKIINLEDSSYLKQSTLDDGSMGYIVTSKYPPDLLPVFSDEKISQNSLNVAIIDYSGDPEVAHTLGQIIEVLGAKTASIDREGAKDFGCEVSGQESLSNKIILLFGCTKTEKEEGSIFDVNLKIGTYFANDF